VIGVLQKPHFEYALARIEVRHGAINVEEYRLDDFFSFTGIAHNPKGHIKDEPMVAIKENSESVLTTDVLVLQNSRDLTSLPMCL
jgi:hypothetical protein